MKKLDVKQMESLQGGLLDYDALQAVFCAVVYQILMDPNNTLEQIQWADEINAQFNCP
jgi:hypothetical protein